MKKWYQQNWFIILSLFMCFPLGICLLWQFSTWKKEVKIAITAFIALTVAIGLFAPSGTEQNSTTDATPVPTAVAQTVAPTIEPTTAAPTPEPTIAVPTPSPAPATPDVPTEYKSALKKAKLYSDTMYMSKKGIYEQLVSEYGEKFSEEAAKYAVDNLQVDYKQNALKKAETYQETMSMSPPAIRDQLTSEYGEQFTAEEADYAIANLK